VTTIFVTGTNSNPSMYSSANDLPLSASDSALPFVSDGLTAYFAALPDQTVEQYSDCVGGAFINNTGPIGTGGPVSN
jgi:hypothetical protein